MFHAVIGLLLCCFSEAVAHRQPLCGSLSIRRLIEVATGSAVYIRLKVSSWFSSIQESSLQIRDKLLQKPSLALLFLFSVRATLLINMVLHFVDRASCYDSW